MVAEASYRSNKLVANGRLELTDGQGQSAFFRTSCRRGDNVGGAGEVPESCYIGER
jgi:hypothetical protein